MRVELIFPKHFLKFRLEMIEKQGIINIRNYINESYTPVVLSDSVVVFLQKRENADFCSFLYCILVIYSIAQNESMSSQRKLTE